ncbi:MAG: hypothetical protein B6I20_03770 [Bacteroidetes bacterium 4572_117]|nr:MAG: hypothetical protein B6I20_03770 [Bacteroidetes bacterium 4572_117]
MTIDARILIYKLLEKSASNKLNIPIKYGNILHPLNINTLIVFNKGDIKKNKNDVLKINKLKSQYFQLIMAGGLY